MDYKIEDYSGYERWVKGIRIGDFLIYQAKEDEWILRDRTKHFSETNSIIFGFRSFEDAVGYVKGE